MNGKKITVVIPCYNQTALLERNLRYLERQTYKDFDIVILDDKSSEDYPEILSKFPNLDIIYKRNEENLGAMGNIFNSIFYETDSPYKISLHEDDVLHPEYIEKSVQILDARADAVFVCSLAEWFKNDAELTKKYSKLGSIGQTEQLDKAGFIRKILDGRHIMWSSVVYRNAGLKKIQDMEKYDVFCDRPFLSSLIGSATIILIDEPVMLTRDHGIDDTRFKNITEEDCFNLLNFYRENLPRPLSRSDSKKMLSYSTNFLMYTHPGIVGRKMSYGRFLRTGHELGLVRLRYVRILGIVGMLKAIFG